MSHLTYFGGVLPQMIWNSYPCCNSSTDSETVEVLASGACAYDYDVAQSLAPDTESDKSTLLNQHEIAQDNLHNSLYMDAEILYLCEKYATALAQVSNISEPKLIVRKDIEQENIPPPKRYVRRVIHHQMLPC